jgi:peptidoglycan hydrolase CwlO-like protein
MYEVLSKLGDPGIILSLLIVFIPVGLFVKNMWKDYLNSKHLISEDKIKQVQQDFSSMKKDVDKLTETVDEIKVETAKMNITEENMKSHMNDFKSSLNRLNDKLEKVTEIVIQILSKDQK